MWAFVLTWIGPSILCLANEGRERLKSFPVILACKLYKFVMLCLLHAPGTVIARVVESMVCCSMLILRCSATANDADWTWSPKHPSSKMGVTGACSYL